MASYAIRHFISTYMRRRLKVSTGTVGPILGHKSKRTTEIYLDSIPSDQVEAMRELEGILEATHTTNPHTAKTESL
jgi:integrase